MQTHTLFLIILLFGINIKSSAQEIMWQNTIGGGNDDELMRIAPTLDGGFILGGNSNSAISGDKTEVCQGLRDYWVVKIDSSGNIQWQNTIGGSENDYLYSVSQTSDGGYIIGGSSESGISGDKTENSQGLEDYWVIKLDDLGNIQWQKTIGGSDNDHLMEISQTFDGGYILAGFSSSNISGDKTENSQGLMDFWIIKIDPSGNIDWQNTIGGSSNEQFNYIVQTPDSGYILGGWSNSNISGDKTENSMGDYDYWVVKLDALGNILWQNTIGGNDKDFFSMIIPTDDGGYIVGGSSLSGISADKNEINYGYYDYWVVKIDSSGALQWQNSIGGQGFDRLYSIHQTYDGGYLLAGNSHSAITGEKNENSEGGEDYWVVKLDDSGKIQWQNTIGGLATEYLNSITSTSDGGILLGGHSGSPISGDKTENSQYFDYWVIKLNGNYNLIQGVEYIDLNNNDTLDISENMSVNKKIIENNTGRFAFTDHDGFYSISVIDSGNYIVSPELIPNYYTSSPLNYSINFSSTNQIDSLNDFALQPTGSFNDLCITMTPTGNFRSGMNASYALSYSNVGSTTIPNTSIVFYPDPNVAYLSASISPLNITPDSVVFLTGNLTPYQTGQIIVTVNVIVGLPIGTVINSGASILPIAGDVNPGCNTGFWEVLTTGSFDPNDILVNRSFLYDYEIPNEPELEYIIRFQNTGNDTAFTVKVLNPIDTTRLQLNSLEIVSASHPMNASWITWERNMQFQFNDILLPDSNVNEPMSHGFIRYKIKPKTNLLVGDSINNMAAIYFDFNSPVLTNSAKTDIALFTGIHETNNSSIIFSLYPNPASTLLNIKFEAGMQKNSSLELYNVFGQKVRVIENNLSDSQIIKTIDIANLTPGVYFVKFEGSTSFVKKFVKY